MSYLDSDQFYGLGRPGPSYRSPFEVFGSSNIPGEYDSPRNISKLDFSGKIWRIGNELQEALATPSDRNSAARIALHPPRLIRGVIDFKIDNSGSENAFSYVREAINVGLDTYQKNGSITLSSFLDRLKFNGERELINRRVKQTKDQATWEATDPVNSYTTAALLRQVVSNPSIFLIGLGHGGTAAGMDVFLTYQDMGGSNDSLFHILRFSQTKHLDMCPRFSEEEVGFMREAAQGRQVVIFDEDVYGGSTMKIAHLTLRRTLELKDPIVIASNAENCGAHTSLASPGYTEEVPVRVNGIKPMLKIISLS